MKAENPSANVIGDQLYEEFSNIFDKKELQNIRSVDAGEPLQK